jgi:HPt (histidine-containing phosphotransfer) domain-containing protein
MMTKLLDASGIGRSTVYSREPGPKGDAQPVFSFDTIDLAYLRDLSGGDLEYEAGMADQFLQNMPDELGQMRAALAANDLAGVSRVAHNMKTTVSVMGLSERLSGLLDQLEFPDGDTDIMATFGRLQLVCERAMEEARQFRISQRR